MKLRLFGTVIFLILIGLIGRVVASYNPSSGGGGLVLVEQHTASASASLDFTTCISATYDEYQIHIVNLLPNTDNVAINFRVSTDGGMTYDSGANYGWNIWTWIAAASGTTGVNSGATAVTLVHAVDTTTANWAVNGVYDFYAPESSVMKLITGKASYRNNVNTSLEGIVQAGGYLSTTAVTDFQILPSSGTFTSGVVRCYGVSKS